MVFSGSMEHVDPLPQKAINKRKPTRKQHGPAVVVREGIGAQTGLAFALANMCPVMAMLSLATLRACIYICACIYIFAWDCR